jgi:diphthamide biosynthesis protein 3
MSIYDEIEIEDMDWKADVKTFYYPCPCGDKFYITLEDLLNGEDVAKCPSCSLRIRIIYDPDDIEERFGKEDSEGGAAAVEVQ